MVAIGQGPAQPAEPDDIGVAGRGPEHLRVPASHGEPDAAALRLRRDGIAAVVVDCEAGPVRLGLAEALARNLGACYLGLGDLSVGALAGSVRAYRRDVAA